MLWGIVGHCWPGLAGLGACLRRVWRCCQVASAVFVLDLKGKILISRDYRGDVPKSAVDKYDTAAFVFRAW